MRVLTLFLAHSIANMVPGDKHDASDGPHLHKNDPHPVFEGALMMIPDPYT